MSNEEKLFYTIGEVAEILQLKPYVLRYWESEFKKLNPQKSFTGQRTYRVRDIQLALTIKKLLYDDKYTIAGAVQKLVELDANNQLVAFGGTPAVESPSEVAADTSAMLEEPVFTKTSTEVPPIAPTPAASEAGKPKPDMQKVKDLKTLMEATKALLKKYNLS